MAAEWAEEYRSMTKAILDRKALNDRKEVMEVRSEGKESGTVSEEVTAGRTISEETESWSSNIRSSVVLETWYREPRFWFSNTWVAVAARQIYSMGKKGTTYECRERRQGIGLRNKRTLP